MCVRVRRILFLLPSVFFFSRAWREEEEEIPGSILFLMSEELFGRIDTPVFLHTIHALQSHQSRPVILHPITLPPCYDKARR